MSYATDDTPQTKTDSYQSIRDAGDDVALRRRVAAAIALEPDTTSGLADRFSDRSSNAIRPRVNELLRMGCVKRDGAKTNPSGHEAYVHYITSRGRRYLDGEINPEPAPTLSELQADVVDVARRLCADAATAGELRDTVRRHDGAKVTRDPEWTPEFDVLTDRDETEADTGTDSERMTDADPQTDDSTASETPAATDGGRVDGLTDDQIEQIENDPVLEVSDFDADGGGGVELSYSEGGQ